MPEPTRPPISPSSSTTPTLSSLAKTPLALDPRTRIAPRFSTGRKRSSSSLLEPRRDKRPSPTAPPLASSSSSCVLSSKLLASQLTERFLKIASFLVLHALNLVTTLTAKTALDRQTDHSPSGPHVTPLDTGSPLLSSALAQLIASHHPNTELVVHVAPAIQFRAIDLTLPLTTSSNAIPENTATGSLASLDRFMSKWTRLVGDPVFSKWIVIALALSLFLNGYLLKGIASGSDSGFAPGSAAEAAARILLASTGSAIDLDEMDTRAKMRRRWSAGVEGQDLQKEWTTEDAAAMTKGYQRRAEEAKEEAEKAAPTLLRVTSERRRGSDSSDEDSPPPSPIFVRTKLRKASTTPHSVAATVGSSGPTLSVSTEREIHLSPSTVALVPLGSIPDTPRTLDVCAKIFDNGVGAMLLNDEEIILLVQKGKVAAYALEKLLKDYERSVAIRRALICASSFDPRCRIVC